VKRGLICDWWFRRDWRAEIADVLTDYAGCPSLPDLPAHNIVIVDVAGKSELHP
jgi:hypothetical protein